MGSGVGLDLGESERDERSRDRERMKWRELRRSTAVQQLFVRLVFCCCYWRRKWERKLDRIWSSESGRPGESRDRESDQREQGQKPGWECINIPASDESNRIDRGHTQVLRRRP